MSYRKTMKEALSDEGVDAMQFANAQAKKIEDQRRALANLERRYMDLGELAVKYKDALHAIYLTTCEPGTRDRAEAALGFALGKTGEHDGTR